VQGAGLGLAIVAEILIRLDGGLTYTRVGNDVSGAYCLLAQYRAA
jgi:C4-dicarboxylate-specific signal transduction histidine kinase